MREFYIIVRTDTDQYYHSLTPGGYPLWVDSTEHAQYLTEEEADSIEKFLNYNPYKHFLKIQQV